MTKRRISKQQSLRINRQQQQYQHMIDRDKIVLDGLVIARYSRHAHIEDQEGRAIHCAIRPNIPSLVAGDRIVWQPEGPGQGTVLSVYPRRTSLGRPDGEGHIKAIAANMTQMMIVIAPQPETSWVLLDSYLVMAETLNIPACIVLNKNDLDTAQIGSELLQCYEPLGYPILPTSIVENDLRALRKSLRKQISVFVGQSGVGKSSLIAHLLPEEAARIKTAKIAVHSQLGCHTTSNSCLYHIPYGGSLIDSPGVRNMSLGAISQAAIAQGYREFRVFIRQCKFRNCTHHKTEGCAVANAVKNNQIPRKRYENYVKLIGMTL